MSAGHPWDERLEVSVHLSEDEIAGLVRGTLANDETEEARLHLAHCALCQALIADLESELAATLQGRQASPSQHLSESEVVGWVRGTLSANEKEEARIHLAECALCQGLVADLARDIVASQPTVEASPQRDNRIHLFAWAAAAAAVFFSIYLLAQGHGTDGQVAEIKSKLDSAAAEKNRLAKELKSSSEALAELQKRQSEGTSKLLALQESNSQKAKELDALKNRLSHLRATAPSAGTRTRIVYRDRKPQSALAVVDAAKIWDSLSKLTASIADTLGPVTRGGDTASDWQMSPRETRLRGEDIKLSWKGKPKELSVFVPSSSETPIADAVSPLPLPTDLRQKGKLIRWSLSNSQGVTATAAFYLITDEEDRKVTRELAACKSLTERVTVLLAYGLVDEARDALDKAVIRNPNDAEATRLKERLPALLDLAKSSAR